VSDVSDSDRAQRILHALQMHHLFVDLEASSSLLALGMMA